MHSACIIPLYRGKKDTDECRNKIISLNADGYVYGRTLAQRLKNIRIMQYLKCKVGLKEIGDKYIRFFY